MIVFFRMINVVFSLVLCFWVVSRLMLRGVGMLGVRWVGRVMLLLV